MCMKNDHMLNLFIELFILAKNCYYLHLQDIKNIISLYSILSYFSTSKIKF